MKGTRRPGRAITCVSLRQSSIAIWRCVLLLLPPLKQVAIAMQGHGGMMVGWQLQRPSRKSALESALQVLKSSSIKFVACVHVAFHDIFAVENVEVAVLVAQASFCDRSDYKQVFMILTVSKRTRCVSLLMSNARRLR